MTREQAINSMISHGFTVEQAGEIIKAVTPQLSVPEVTALAEWAEKLTKASEDAYNKGYTDGMKAQEPKIGHWRHYEGMLICSECGTEFYDDIMEYCGDDVPKYCPNCGCCMVEPQERSDKE